MLTARLCSRSLGAAANVAGAGRPGQYKPYLLQIYSATVARLNRLDSDQEIKERGISCLGVSSCSRW